MASPNILKELKGVNFSSCTNSPDEHFSSMLMQSLGSGSSSGRAIDRFSPHLRDPLRAKSRAPDPDLTLSSPATATTTTTTNYKPKIFGSSPKKPPIQQQQQQLISPASSSRYLLSGSASDDHLWDSTTTTTKTQAAEVVTEVASEEEEEEEAWRWLRSPKLLQSTTSTVVKKAEIEPSTQLQSIKLEELQSTTTAAAANDDPEYSSSSSSSSSSPCSSSGIRPQNHQVVVLRVSLHCKGCEAKVRKHISKMEGVTSFTTDLVNKKVTVIGDVTPLGVLNSISKVKNAQLWRSLPPTSSPSTKNLS